MRAADSTAPTSVAACTWAGGGNESIPLHGADAAFLILGGVHEYDIVLIYWVPRVEFYVQGRPAQVLKTLYTLV